MEENHLLLCPRKISPVQVAPSSRSWHVTTASGMAKSAEENVVMLQLCPSSANGQDEVPESCLIQAYLTYGPLSVYRSGAGRLYEEHYGEVPTSIFKLVRLTRSSNLVMHPFGSLLTNSVCRRSVTSRPSGET